MRLPSAVILLALLAYASIAGAQTVIRTLPEDAKRGRLSHVQENVLTLDGKKINLAPAGQIRGSNNLIIQPLALPRDSLVKYQLDANGNLHRAWVLTSEEAAKSDRPTPQSSTGRPQ
jgi:hypothetical protein